MERFLEPLDAERATAYLELLGLCDSFAVEGFEPTREHLDTLVFAHQCRVPFSTMDVRGESIPALDIDSLYKQVVVDRRGGYCFQLNKLFEALLKALGYSTRPVYARAVRGRGPEGRMPIQHRGLLVELGGVEHVVDVGFGGPVPAGSVALIDGLTQIVRGESFTPRLRDAGGMWWNIDRITRAALDTYDDRIEVREHTELELCMAPVEELDFDALNLSASVPGVFFVVKELVNLRTPEGNVAYVDGHLTLRCDGERSDFDLAPEERADAIEEHFGFRI